MKQIAQLLFYSASTFMVWWVFIWPFVIPGNQHEAILHVGALTTLVIFLVSLILLLVLRIRNMSGR